MDARRNQSAARPPTTDHKKGLKKKKKKDDASLKVVYISSPMKVRTSASKFRSLVQELTGKNSDIAQYMDGDGAGLEFHDNREVVAEEQSGHQMVSSDGAAGAAGLDSFLGSADNVFAASQFGGSSADSYYGACSYWDVLGSYDELV